MRVQLDKPDKFKELEGHKLVGHVEKRGDAYWFVVDEIAKE